MAQQFSTAAEAELACPVCFQFYVPPHDPKNFPNCAHTCCRLCLIKMTEGGLKTIKCPQCNKVSTLPDEGVDNLMTMLALRNLAEKHPEGIKQRKEHMQDELAKEKVGTVKTVDKLHELEKKMHESIKQEELEIERAVEAIMTKAQELIGRIRENSQSKLTEIQQRLAKLEEQIKSIDAAQSKLQTMPDGEFITQTDTLATQIAKLQIDENEAVQIHSDHRICKFVANASLGKIIQLRKLELVEEFGEFESTFGIGTLSTDSLVVSDAKQQVVVFENKSGNYEKTLEFKVKLAKGLTDQWIDVATTPGDQILMTNMDANIEMYSSDGKHRKQITSKCKSDSTVQEVITTIATTADGRILAGSGFKQEDIRWNVTVYDAAGNILKTIPTSVTPYRIADIRGTMVAVCDCNKNKVCVYDLQSGKETLNLDVDSPTGIIYDEHSDCLLIGHLVETDEVGDEDGDLDGDEFDGSGVIEQYCSTTGTLVARLAQGLFAPFSMTFTRDGTVLAVADGETVKLYKLS